jgi:anti-sigma regulatory factor (Ser/Thr protein kinase)
MGSANRLTVPGRYDQINAICDFVAQGAEQAGLDADAAFHVQLACDEACTNIIEHAYGGESQGDIDVSWKINRQTFTITLKDKGQPFNPNSVETPNIPQHPNEIDQLKIGGLGLHFMRRMMDELIFQFDEKSGNTLIMVKRIKPEEAV